MTSDPQTAEWASIPLRAMFWTVTISMGTGVVIGVLGRLLDRHYGFGADWWSEAFDQAWYMTAGWWCKVWVDR